MSVRHRSPRGPVVLILLGLAVLLGSPGAGAQEGGGAVSIELNGSIDPATAGWAETALEDAAAADRRLVIIRLDTPGGLDASMREIVRAIIAAPMPVVVHVAPSGARAASAGLFITQAADVAVMAPGTNIGSATPVSLSGEGGEETVLGRKIRNDAVAYVRALAEAHGRNADLAERMVRDAVNVTARRAEREGLVDVVAEDQAALMAAIDGFEVQGPKAQTLRTAELGVQRRDTPTLVEIEQLLVNPTVAYLLLLAGLAGLAIEAFSPGLVGPGLFGAIALVLGLYGTAQLPVSAAGIVLLALGLGFLAAEVFVAGGILGIAGTAALVVGGLVLFDTDSEALAVSVPAALAVGLLLGGLVLFAANRALAARRRAPRGGREDLVGRRGEVRVPLDPTGQVYVQGALWRARSADEASVERGRPVVVEAVEGLTLTVRPLPEEEREPA
jgi:membrane-bound serine protease (ClpP class)